MHPIAEKLLAWFDREKRDLPWRHTKDPYCIWISEIMLQQTRTETVKGYYSRFLERFPTVGDLASAPEQDVLKMWEGLGYYSRARNLQKAAKRIMSEYSGIFPANYGEILSLPGVGAYTAGAVSSIAFGVPVPAVDGNVLRVTSRLFGIREEITSGTSRTLVDCLIRECIPQERPGDFNQSLMELGATCCCPGTPDCGRCPLADFCDAYSEGDADVLPVHEMKKPPRPVELAVCLVEWQGSLFVERRTQSMLKGLYVFRLEENETDPRELVRLFAREGLECEFIRDFGPARHVFTHRIWNMRVLHFKALRQPSAEWMEDGFFTSVPEQYPFPNAMRRALECARTVLGSETDLSE